MKNRLFLQRLSISAMTAALYVILTLLSQAAGLASGVVQVRISEALTILPVFSFAAVPGLAVGCLLANLLTGCALWDVVFGTLATALGALGTYLLKKHRLSAVLPPVASNTVIVPLILRFVYAAPGSIPYFMLTVGIGEFISCAVLGTVLRKALERTKIKFPD